MRSWKETERQIYPICLWRLVVSEAAIMVFSVISGFNGGFNVRDLDSVSFCILYQSSHDNHHAYTNISCAPSHFLLHSLYLYCILYLYEAVHKLQEYLRRAAHT